MNISLYQIKIATAVCLCGAALWVNVNPSKRYGTVVILNGPSASGKTSIQKEFQQLMMPDLWIKVGIDSLFDAPMPNITLENMQYWQSENPIRWITTNVDGNNNSVIALHTGHDGEKVAHGMNSAIAGYAKEGCNVIVDYIAYKKEWVDDLRRKLKNIPTLWVKVNIPLQTLEARETARATSPKGHARSHYATVHWDIQYNHEVDSENKSVQRIAQEIKKLTESPNGKYYDDFLLDDSK